ncbi:MAG: hypothetical protein MI794_16725 [Pseudomonadales bacterium]|nr:hypothetical protein [Pseudomonadales bacterium]
MRLRLLLPLLFVLACPVTAAADALDGLTVVSLAPADAKAVVSSPSRPLQVVRVGDALFGSEYVVKQVLADKLLLRDRRDHQLGNVIWVHKARPGLASEIERIEAVEPEPQEMFLLEKG